MNTLAIMCLASLSSLCLQPFKAEAISQATTENQPILLRYEPSSKNTYGWSGQDNPSNRGLNPKSIKIDLKKANGWEIRVNNRPILTTINPLDVAVLLTRFNLLLKRPNLDPEQIQPAQIGDRYIGMLGSEELFTLSANKYKNPTLTLFTWVNNLRQALGASPLTLLEAQERMYGIVPTGKDLQGLASWYGPYFQGRTTASGEVFEQQDFTAAHQDLPFNTYLKVTNLRNGNSVVVRINDRGPYVPPRMLDLSYAAAAQLNCEEAGVVPIQATVMSKP